MDTMDDVPNATARKRFMGIYLDFYPNLANVRVAGSNTDVCSKSLPGNSSVTPDDHADSIIG